jgi:hypothetical protein
MQLMKFYDHKLKIESQKPQKNAQDEWGRKTSNNNNNDPSHIHLLMIKVLNKPGKCYQAVHIQPLGLVSLSLGSSQPTRSVSHATWLLSSPLTT